MSKVKLAIISSLVSYIKTSKLPLKTSILETEKILNSDESKNPEDIQNSIRKNSIENSSRKIGDNDNDDDYDPESAKLGKRAYLDYDDYESFLVSDLTSRKKLKFEIGEEDQLKKSLNGIMDKPEDVEYFISALKNLKEKGIDYKIIPNKESKNTVYLMFTDTKDENKGELYLKVFVQENIVVSIDRCKDMKKVIKKVADNLDKRFDQAILNIVIYWSQLTDS